jgi:protein TonB
MRESSGPRAGRPFTPQLGVEWEPPGRGWLENLRTILSHEDGRPHPRSALTRQHSAETYFPRHAILYSVLFHFVIVFVPLPGWPGSSDPQIARPDTEYHLTYYGPLKDLPPLGGKGRLAAPPAPKKATPRRGADAFHPRQTIVSMPKQPNHPRQTLIQPNAPQIAPKLLPPLPNIVQWSQAPRPARPRFNIRAPVIGKVRRRTTASVPPADLPLPSVPNLERNLGELNIAASPVVNPRPRFAVTPMSVPQAGPRQDGGSPAEPAPQIGPNVGNGNGGVQNLIALSATPAPPAPVIEVPPGNLQARVSISPDGTQPGVPGDSANGDPAGGGTGPGGTAGASSTGGGGPAGPPGVSISGGNPGDTSTVAGLSTGSATRPLILKPLPAKPTPRIVPGEPGRVSPMPGLDRIKPGSPPEEILGPKRVYTAYVDAPNLTSATGSWLLRFAELNQEKLSDANTPGDGGGNRGELSTPMPIRKVDPKYPPALAEARVEGEVILYAIIRKDGTVDSIQLVRGLEPQLDRNAMEALARWRFRPAERAGTAVELEAVIHIPFRIFRPAFGVP